MASMKRIVCQEFAPVSQLAYEDAPDPRPNEHQVLIRVGAAGVNFVDGLFVQGTYQIKPPLPFVPGSEVCGEVIESGSATGFVPGDRVIANLGLGGYTTHALADHRSTYHCPAALSDAQGATLGQSYLTAWFSLTCRTQVQPGETVLVLGGAGGVGLASIDVARSLGARVIASASSESKRQRCLDLGADATIDADPTTWKSALADLDAPLVDVVVDPVGGESTEAATRRLGPFGRLLVIGFAAGSIPRIPTNFVLLRNRQLLGVDWGLWALEHPAENSELTKAVLAHCASGKLNPTHPQLYPLQDAARALADLAERRVSGKVALIPETTT